MKHLILILVISTLLSACFGSPPRPISRFEMQTPRSFGYLVGDEIHHRLVLETRSGMRLNPSSLPVIGDVNRWLTIKQVKVRHAEADREMTIDLTYQVFYAPLEVKDLTIPSFSLQFQQGEKILEQVVPEWHFYLSPIQALAARQQVDRSLRMQPDHLPSPLSTETLWMGVNLALGVSTLLALYLSYLYGYLPIFTRQRIFKHAGRQLANLTIDDMGRAIAVMHHALNSLNGAALFSHQLPAFFQAHPDYRQAEVQIVWFYAFSNQVLFGNWQGFGQVEWQKLNRLCQLCRAIERGSR